jgi:hypothetical protein
MRFGAHGPSLPCVVVRCSALHHGSATAQSRPYARRVRRVTLHRDRQAVGEPKPGLRHALGGRRTAARLHGSVLHPWSRFFRDRR